MRTQLVQQLDTHLSDVAALCGTLVSPHTHSTDSMISFDLLFWGLLTDFSRKQKELSAQRIGEAKQKDKEKVFRWRDSQLSVMFRTTKVRSLPFFSHLRCCCLTLMSVNWVGLPNRVSYFRFHPRHLHGT